ncbi:hypothetical protein PAXRUDRAFT_217875 [Paxillus rubicundulus Ve08.2h10]|uniref:Uncharacterized protein n=1 Tax=Paxillus rubicundulus Ve08.2h10 TaxID=930991 RepID=A0A0D0EAN1_9AGAM|nr:hypothetical protein PAXRUDRAFT_217875 [Paxillus rubicundulus Ve08.2h10]
MTFVSLYYFVLLYQVLVKTRVASLRCVGNTFMKTGEGAIAKTSTARFPILTENVPSMLCAPCGDGQRLASIVVATQPDAEISLRQSKGRKPRGFIIQLTGASMALRLADWSLTDTCLDLGDPMCYPPLVNAGHIITRLVLTLLRMWGTPSRLG